MKKLFLFFSVVFGVMFFWGCSKQTILKEPIKSNNSITIIDYDNVETNNKLFKRMCNYTNSSKVFYYKNNDASNYMFVLTEKCKDNPVGFILKYKDNKYDLLPAFKVESYFQDITGESFIGIAKKKLGSYFFDGERYKNPFKYSVVVTTTKKLPIIYFTKMHKYLYFKFIILEKVNGLFDIERFIFSTYIYEKPLPNTIVGLYDLSVKKGFLNYSYKNLYNFIHKPILSYKITNLKNKSALYSYLYSKLNYYPHDNTIKKDMFYSLFITRKVLYILSKEKDSDVVIKLSPILNSLKDDEYKQFLISLINKNINQKISRWDLYSFAKNLKNYPNFNKYFNKQCRKIEWRGKIDKNFLPTGQGCLYCISREDDVYGICGTMKNSKFVGSGKVKVALTDGMFFGYSTSFKYEKYNNPREIKYALNKAYSRAVKVWNSHYSSKSTSSSYSGDITISGCYNKTCRVKIGGNYIGTVSYWTKSYSGGTYYVISFSSDDARYIGEQASYYPKTNEIYMSKCGTKRGVYSLKQAMIYVVKCAVSGHY